MVDSSVKLLDVPRKPGDRGKRQKFVKLAEKRTVNAIRAIRIIGKLGNPAAYEYDESDIKKIAKALTDEVEAMKTRMKSTKQSDDVAFKL